MDTMRENVASGCSLTVNTSSSRIVTFLSVNSSSSEQGLVTEGVTVDIQDKIYNI